MAFKLENFGSEVANAKSTLGGICYYRYFNKENNTLTTAGYFPATLGLEVGDRIRVIPSVKTDADEIYIVTSTANRTVTVKQIDTDGAVDSVNGKTGAVVLVPSDIGAATSAQGTKADTAVQPGEAVPQYKTMPTASADLDGVIVQYTGATDATYTNGYFYKCAGAGEPVVYSWTQTNVQPTPVTSVNGSTGAVTVQATLVSGTNIKTINGTSVLGSGDLTVSGLPSMTSQSGKFLTNNGSAASWATISALQNTATGNDALTILGNPSSQEYGLNIGANSTASGWSAIALGIWAQATKSGALCIGGEEASGKNAIAIGRAAKVTANGAVMINTTDGIQINSNANTLAFGNTNGVFEIISADGTIPATRHATLPAADGTYVLKLVISSGVPTLSWVAE